MRPYFKFTLPTLDIQPAERDIWDQAATEALDISQVYYTGYLSGILHWISVRYTTLDIQLAERDIWDQAATEALEIQSGILYWISSLQRGISGTRLNISSQI